MPKSPQPCLLDVFQRLDVHNSVVLIHENWDPYGAHHCNLKPANTLRRRSPRVDVHNSKNYGIGEPLDFDDVGPAIKSKRRTGGRLSSQMAQRSADEF
jgi:hypothetical protein